MFKESVTLGLIKPPNRIQPSEFDIPNIIMGARTTKGCYVYLIEQQGYGYVWDTIENIINNFISPTQSRKQR